MTSWRGQVVGTLVMLTLTGFAGCRRNDDGVVRREGQPDYYEAFDERRMDAAMAEARATLGTFIAALDAREEGADGFAVKKGFPHGEGEREFIWINQVRREGGAFIGRVNNEPVNALGISLGESVRVERDDVVDWMFMSKGSLRGGYTIVALAYGTPDQDTYGERMKIDWKAYRFLEATK
jgi:uncharacterized protein YegJ (DUF2314 family)